MTLRPEASAAGEGGANHGRVEIREHAFDPPGSTDNADVHTLTPRPQPETEWCTPDAGGAAVRGCRRAAVRGP